MARSVSLGFTVNSASATKKLDDIFNKLKTVNNEWEKHAKNGKVKFQFETNNSVTASDFDKLTNALNRSATAMENAKKRAKPVTDEVAKTGKTAKEASGGVDDLVVSFTKLFVLSKVKNMFSGFNEQSLTLENATYGLGVASQVSLGHISKLRTEFSHLSTIMPITSTELALATDSLVRTGRSLSDAQMIITKTAKLAIASGDTLSETSAVVTKVMVAMGIEGKNTDAVLTSLHSTAIQTASSMQGLADGFKQVAGTASVFVNASGKSGEALDEYRQKVLDMSLASIGALNNLGLSSSQSGTKIKVMFSKLVAMEKTAKMLFDKNMASKTISIDNEDLTITADKLAEIAKVDLGKALTIVSKLYKAGDLTDQTLQKMFTGRHFMEASYLLRVIDGDMEKFITSITKGVDYVSDFEKQMFNLNNIFAITKNNFFVGWESGTGWAFDATKGMLMLYNSVVEVGGSLPSVVGDFVSFGTNIAFTTFSVGALSIGLTKLFGIMNAKRGADGISILASTLKMAMNPVTIAIGAVTLAIGAVAYASYQAKVRLGNLDQAVSDVARGFGKAEANFKLLSAGVDYISDIYSKFIDGSAFSKDLLTIDSVMDRILSKIPSYVEEMKIMSQIQSSPMPLIDINSMTSDVKKYSDELDSMKVKLGDSISKMADTSSITSGLMYGRQDSRQELEEVLKSMLDYRSKKSELDKESSKNNSKQITELDFVKKHIEGLGISSEKVKRQISDLSYNINPLEDITSQVTALAEKEIEANKRLALSISQVNERRSAFLSLQKLVLDEDKKTDVSSLMQIGTIFSVQRDDSDNLKISKLQGEEAFKSIEDNYFKEDVLAKENLMNRKNDLVKIIEGNKEAYDIISRIKSEELTSSQLQEKNNYEEKQKQLLKYSGEISEMEKKSKYMTNLSPNLEGRLKTSFKGIDFSDQEKIKKYGKLRIEMFSTLARLQQKMNELKDVELDIERVKASYRLAESHSARENIDLQRNNLSIKKNEIQNQINIGLQREDTLNKDLLTVRELDNKKTKEVANSRIKYISVLYQNYDIELALSKLYMTESQQQALQHSIKMKNLKEEQNERKKEMALRLEQLNVMKNSSLSMGGKVQESDLLSPELYAKLEARKAKAEQAGAVGGKYKQDYDTIVSLMKAINSYRDSSDKMVASTITLATVSLEKNRALVEDILAKTAKLAHNQSKRLGITDFSIEDSEIDKAKRNMSNVIADIRSTIERDMMSNKPIGLSSMIGGFETMTTSDLNKVALQESESLIAMKDKIKGSGGVVSQDDLDSLEKQGSLIELINKLLENRLSLEDAIQAKQNKKLEGLIAEADQYQKIGDLLMNISQTTGSKLLGSIGGLLGSGSAIMKGMAKQNMGYEAHKKESEISGVPTSFINYLKTSANGLTDLTELLGGGLATGSLVGQMMGGNASSQAGASLGGMLGSAGAGTGIGKELLGGLGAFGGVAGSVIGSVAGSLLGGMFKDDSQERADKYNKEQAKIYQQNTDALNKLAQNMSKLSSGVDGLNGSLISSFSKVPTFGKLNNVTDTLKGMYKTMLQTRDFTEVAYQVTKKKKGKKGVLGMGATPDTQWTETVKVNVQSLIDSFGFKGTIEDMTANQLRDFSKYLDKLDMGDSDNFSVLAGAIEDYAEAIDKMDKNINNFFKDATLEGFQGISSLQQAELRTQIEDFYKSLGITIDDSMTAEIDKLAEQMSVMVTVMGDVRGKFLETWRGTGADAGSAFLQSMSPYIDALLNNMSQVFYDVYFSDVNEELEKQFKTISEKLVELKKEGKDLDWGKLTGEMGGSFDKVLEAIISAKDQSTSFNDILMELQKRALELGFSLSELGDLGLLSGTQQGVLDTFKEALKATEEDGAIGKFGEYIGNTIGDAMSKKMMDTLMGDKILEFSNAIDKTLAGSMNFAELANLAQLGLSVGLQMEGERKKYEALMSMFDYNKDINYLNEDNKIEYQTGSSSQNIYNITLSSKVEAGNIIYHDDLNDLAGEMLDGLIAKMEDRGIYLDNR